MRPSVIKGSGNWIREVQSILDSSHSLASKMLFEIELYTEAPLSSQLSWLVGEFTLVMLGDISPRRDPNSRLTRDVKHEIPQGL